VAVLVVAAAVLGSPESFRGAAGAFLGRRAGGGLIRLLADPRTFMTRSLGETASAWTLLALAFTTAGFMIRGRRAAQLRAVMVTTFREMVRSGALGMAVLTAGCLAAAALFLDSEGGTSGRMKMIVAAAGAAASLIGTLLAVALPAVGMAREHESRSLYVLVSKPVPRWTLFSGRLLATALALAVVVLAAGLGGAGAALLAMRGDAARAGHEAGEKLWLAAWYARGDERPPLPDGPGRPSAERYYRGRRLSLELPVGPDDVVGDWLVMRIHARPAEPMFESSPVAVTCGGREYRVNVGRSFPLDLVLPASAVSGGRLAVGLESLLDSEGQDRGLCTDPRGTVVLVRSGDSLPVTLLKSMALIWMQLLVVATATLTAAAVMSMQVSVLVGGATAVAGHLSGLAVGVVRGALAAAARVPGGDVHVHGPACGQECGVGAAPALDFVQQLPRHGAAGLFSLLPDFEATGAADYISAGSRIPLSLLVMAVLVLLVMRAVPLAVLGCLVLRRREVGL
jgi:hypothetical protein